MRKWLRPDWRARLLDLFACFLIPLYTLLFTHDTRWFTTNFSVIAAARDQRHGFVLWGLLVGGSRLGVLLPEMTDVPEAEPPVEQEQPKIERTAKTMDLPEPEADAVEEAVDLASL